MCGIVGFINTDYKLDLNLKNINKMTQALKHRGPDNYNIWSNKDSNIYLGHTRLSILDLSSNGSQPMISKNKKIIITFNGEIYNHLELRKKINLFSSNFIEWKGTSDTETLVNSISVFGIEKTLKLIKGMFAFAAYDLDKKLVYLARDRSGEKPLYYGFIENSFVFGSELKSIRSNSNFNNNIDIKSLSSFFLFSYVPSPNSIYQNLFKLEPGHYLKIDVSNIKTITPLINKLKIVKVKWIDEENLKIQNYHSTNQTNEFHKILINSVKKQMITDVPIGAFLSGGIDSSLIVCLMQNLSSDPINTFTIGFNDKNFDESKYARKIANHLGTNHNELILSHNDLINQATRMHEVYDEPFADSSQIPTFILSKFARSKVKVSLSGDGGDELFGGYNRYIWSQRIWNWLVLLPLPLRYTLSKFLLLFSDNFIQHLQNPLNKYFLKNLKVNNLSEKIKKLHSKINSSKNFKDFYITLVTEWSNLNELLVDYEYDILDNYQKRNLPNIFNNNTINMMYWDYKTYLPDDILCKLDRAAMSNGLETRVPFLDNEVINYAFSLPLNYKIKENKSKWILREILKKYLPNQLIDRPKMGFSIPLADWLRGPLKEWANESLSNDIFKNEELFNFDYIKKIWDNHLNNRENNHNKIWQLIIFASWYQNNKGL